MRSKKTVGFSQRIRLEWLEYTAEQFLSGKTEKEIKSLLDELLKNQLSIGHNTKRGAREKAISILLKIWVTPPKHLRPFRDDALKHLKRLSIDERISVHWGMTMTVYPFFGLVAETAGRLLKLQGSFTPAQVLRRIKEQFGDRETVTRATRRILRCFVDWGVLSDTEKKGIYQQPAAWSIKDKKLAAWLIEAVLISGNFKQQLVSAVTQNPSLFPFDIGMITYKDLELNQRLELFRQRVDEDIVMIKYWSSPPKCVN